MRHRQRVGQEARDVASASSPASQNIVEIRPLDVEDLREVASVHRAAFPRSALTRLGAEAVRRYYEWQLTGPHEVYAVGAFRAGRCVGFSVGGSFRGAMTGFLRRNRLFLATRVATRPWILSNPVFRKSLRSGLRLLAPPRPPQAASASTATSSAPSFEILSIAVDPRCQGAGIGKRLLIDSEDVARRRGFHHFFLTVHTGNAPAIHLYERLGWRRRLEGDAWKGAMEKTLG